MLMRKKERERERKRKRRKATLKARDISGRYSSFFGNNRAFHQKCKSQRKTRKGRRDSSERERREAKLRERQREGGSC